MAMHMGKGAGCKRQIASAEERRGEAGSGLLLELRMCLISMLQENALDQVSQLDKTTDFVSLCLRVRKSDADRQVIRSSSVTKQKMCSCANNEKMCSTARKEKMCSAAKKERMCLKREDVFRCKQGEDVFLCKQGEDVFLCKKENQCRAQVFPP